MIDISALIEDSGDEHELFIALAQKYEREEVTLKQLLDVIDYVILDVMNSVKNFPLVPSNLKDKTQNQIWLLGEFYEAIAALYRARYHIEMQKGRAIIVREFTNVAQACCVTSQVLYKQSTSALLYKALLYVLR